MPEFSFKKIKERIKNYGYYPYGWKDFYCAQLSKKHLDYFKKHGKLLHPCNECYKALLFWDDNFNAKNVKNFFAMIESFPYEYIGKLCDSVAIFYFGSKSEVLDFNGFLAQQIAEFKVKGRIQWRKACREYQDRRPEVWKNAKERI